MRKQKMLSKEVILHQAPPAPTGSADADAGQIMMKGAMFITSNDQLIDGQGRDTVDLPLEQQADDATKQTAGYHQRHTQWQAASAALANVEAWLRDGQPHGTALEPIETEVKLAKGESSLLDAIENRRRRVRELRADLHRIRSAPYPSSHAKRRMREMIEQLAERGAPSVSRLVELDGPVDFQTTRMQSQVIGSTERSLAFSEQPDAVALIAFLHKSALIAALDAEIDAEADDGASLSQEDRQQREAEAMGDLLDIERQEASLVWQAQQSLLPVEHRADINPVALLGVVLITVTNGHTEPTSWMHGYDIVRR